MIKPISTAVALAAGLTMMGSAANAALIAHYAFDNDIADSSGNGYNLNAVDGGTGGTIGYTGSGAFGSAIDLTQDTTNSGDYLYSTNSSAFQVTGGDFTVGVWFQSDLGGVFQQIMGNVNTNSNTGWSVNTSGLGGAVGGDLEDVSDGDFVSTATPGDTASTWHHLVMRLSGSDLNLFLDGAVVSTDTIVDTSISSLAFSVGARNVNTAGNLATADLRPFDGRLDEIWIYDHALTNTEVSNLHTFNNIDGDTSVPVTGTLVLSLLGLGLMRRRFV